MQSYQNEVKTQFASFIKQGLLFYSDYYQQGFESYQSGNLTRAFGLFLAGATCFNVPCLIKLGEMVLEGEGCQSNPFLASHFFQAAVVYSTSYVQKMYALAHFKAAYEKGLVNGNQNLNVILSDIDSKIRMTCNAITPLKSQFIYMLDKPFQRLLSLSETYLVMCQIEFSMNDHHNEHTNQYVENACRYIEEAYQLIENGKDIDFKNEVVKIVSAYSVMDHLVVTQLMKKLDLPLQEREQTLRLRS